MNILEKARQLLDYSAKNEPEAEGTEIVEETKAEPEVVTPASIFAAKQKNPDNIIELDVSAVKTLQIGYQAETIFLYKSQDNNLIIKEYINGLEGSEYYGKLTANRFKTTIRYGRREEVNYDTYVEIFLPDSFKGELLLSSQYGSIFSEEEWNVERFVAETTQGIISLKKVVAPRIRMSSSTSPIEFDETVGFTDLHTVSGRILARCIQGGAKLDTSDAPIYANFASLNNIVEANTVSADIELVFAPEIGLDVDGISKRGEIESELEGTEIKTKPGNIKIVSGKSGQKPFQRVKISTINGNIILHH